MRQKTQVLIVGAGPARLQRRPDGMTGVHHMAFTIVPFMSKAK